MEKVFFMEGDMVELRQDLQNKPEMMVQSVVKSTIGDTPRLLGIKCMWFTTDMLFQVQVFSTKDLVHIKR